MRSPASRAIRALPTLLRIGVAETVAYRAEFLVWMLTSTMPLINLAFWSAVARDGKFEGYDAPQLTAYFLGCLIVRNLTGNWVAWQLSEEIRMGVLSMRLLRPMHPFIGFASSQSAALPFRSLIAVPIAVILLVTAGGSALTTDPGQLLLFVPSVLLAWLLTFCFMFALGCMSFWITQSYGVFAVYFGLWSLFSGYMLPMDIMSVKFPLIASLAKWLPFYSMLGAPIEMMTKPLTGSEMLHIIGVQVLWFAIFLLVALRVWRAGIRKFEAVGG